MSHEVTILSAYNGRLHATTIKRAESLIGIEVDGQVVYFDETEAEDYGVTVDDDTNRIKLLIGGNLS